MNRKKINILELDLLFKNVARIIFNATAITSCAGYVIDILNFDNSSVILLYNNLFTISITLIAFFLYHLKKINIKSGLSIIVYAAIFNVIVDTFTNINAPDRLNFFLRDSLFIILVLTIVSLIANKIHALIINGLYSIVTLIFTLITKNSFLLSSIYIIILFVTAYSIVVYFFVKTLEKTIADREEQKNIIHDQNTELSETNTLIEERQQQFEEQTEQLLSQTEYLEQVKTELEELNKSKDKFFSIISHDLRSPFNTIFGFAEILQQKKSSLTEQKRDQYISAIYTSAKKVYVLLENLLQWSRTQTNRIKFEPRSFNVGEIAEEIYQLQETNLQVKGIRFETRIDKDAKVFADYEMVHVVMRNLISNAIKFTPKGGKIIMKIKNGESQAEISVTDTGVGISNEDIRNLFIIDKTVTTAGTDGERGTGLGLILCKDFVGRNGGKIWATSEKGKGSTFTFTLPAGE